MSRLEEDLKHARANVERLHLMQAKIDKKIAETGLRKKDMTVACPGESWMALLSTLSMLGLDVGTPVTIRIEDLVWRIDPHMGGNDNILIHSTDAEPLIELDTLDNLLATVEMRALED